MKWEHINKKATLLVQMLRFWPWKLDWLTFFRHKLFAFAHRDQWPKQGGPLPEYQVKFTDGCIPANLHNASDCPANFPTLDTLPRERVSGITTCTHIDYASACIMGQVIDQVETSELTAF